MLHAAPGEKMLSTSKTDLVTKLNLKPKRIFKSNLVHMLPMISGLTLLNSRSEVKVIGKCARLQDAALYVALAF